MGDLGWFNAENNLGVSKALILSKGDLPNMMKRIVTEKIIPVCCNSDCEARNLNSGVCE